MTETDELRFIGCKFTVEHRQGVGGDWEHNVGGTQDEKRVTFDGYATGELYDALMASIREVLE